MGRSNDELSKGIFHEEGMLFHGTDTEFAPGDTVLPAQKAGVKPVWSSQGIKGDVAYATPDPEAAAFFANDATRINRQDFDHARIYQVEPIDETDTRTKPLYAMVTRMSINKSEETGKLEEPEEVLSPSGFRVKKQVTGPDERLCRKCSGQGHHAEYVQTSAAPVKWAATGNRTHCQDCDGTGVVGADSRKGWW